MKLLLDAHSFLWWIMNVNKISRIATILIERLDNELYLSSASVWEIAIKTSIGKLELTEPLDTFIVSQLAKNQIQELPVCNIHAVHVAQLPWHHRDPFDRIIIAQSLTEAMPIISKDEIFDAYGVQRLW